MHEQRQKFGDEVLSGNTGGWRQKQEGLQPMPTSTDTINSLVEKGVDIEKTYIRDTNITFLSNPELYDLIWPYIKEANKSANWNFDWDYTEDMQFAKYSEGQFYGWHTDSSDRPYKHFNPETDPIHKHPDGSPYLNQFGHPTPEDHNTTDNINMIGKIRKISVTISLNDPSEYDGGNLEFDLGPHRPDRYHTCTEIRPKGSIIVFPSHVHHQVTPVTRGTRYSLVCWSLGAPFK
jgi:PKHD-type hydroxylase